MNKNSETLVDMSVNIYLGKYNYIHTHEIDYILLKNVVAHQQKN